MGNADSEADYLNTFGGNRSEMEKTPRIVEDMG